MSNIRIQKFIIHPALRSLIRNIVIIEVDFAKVPEPMEGNYMPSPEQAMFINLGTRFKSKKAGEKYFSNVTSCTLIGAQITPFKLLVDESHTAVSIIFQPGGLNRFLNIPITEIFDEGYSAREVVGRDVQELLDRSHDAVSLEQLNDIIQLYFLKKIGTVKELLPIDYALQHLLVNYNSNIDDMAAMASMSIRTFERRCKERLGMPAKIYARIARFYKAYKILESRRRISMTDLTYEAGYFDQTHFIKDFKEFARQTPTIISKELSHAHTQFQIDWDLL